MHKWYLFLFKDVLHSYYSTLVARQYFLQYDMAYVIDVVYWTSIACLDLTAFHLEPIITI